MLNGNCLIVNLQTLQQEFRYSEHNFSEENFRRKALRWAESFNQVAYYTSNEIPYLYQGFENLLAVSSQPPEIISPKNAFKFLEEISNSNRFWSGMLSYDLKNQIEHLSSNHPDLVGFPAIHFFEPEIYLTFEGEKTTVFSRNNSPEIVLKEILAFEIIDLNTTPVSWQSRVCKADYLKNVERLKDQILEGDVYELNYCLEFFAENATIFPVVLFEKLNARSPMPFAGFFKVNHTVLMCASPERFLKKENLKIIAQPIKGTIRRSQNPEEDLELQNQLLNDEKERAENLMIVDLMRNDLSRSAETGSVKVEELFGIYGFRHISQMISTITAIAKKN